MLVQIAIIGQYMENYAIHDWDGKGEYPQHWKAKFSTPELVVCNVKLEDLHDVVSDIRARLHDFSYENPASSYSADDVVVMPNRLACHEFIEWEYKSYDDIASITSQAIATFNNTFNVKMMNEPFPLPYEHLDII